MTLALCHAVDVNLAVVQSLAEGSAWLLMDAAGPGPGFPLQFG
jgi:hypothetical protein